MEKKNIIYVVFTIIILVNQVKAQPSSMWIKNYNSGSSLTDKAVAIAIDNNCNTYVVGLSDSLGTSTNYITIKYNENGNIIWKNSFDGTDHLDDIPSAIKVDGLGNVYVTGKSNSLNNNYDFLTIKYNSNGQLQWVSRLNSTNNLNDYATDLAIDLNGNVFVCGNQGNGVAIVKYNSNGIKQASYEAQPVGNSTRHFYKIKILNSGSIDVLADYAGIGSNQINIYHFDNLLNYINYTYFVRTWNSSVFPDIIDFSYNTNGEIFVLANGQYNSVDQIELYSTLNINNNDIFAIYRAPNNSNSKASSIKIDNSNNVYVCGYTDIDPDNTINMDFMTLKYNSNGIEQWNKTFGNSLEDVGSNLVLGNGSNPDVYVIGYTTNTSNNKDITSVKYNNLGVLQSNWTQTFNSVNNEDDIPTNVKIDSYNNIIITGYSGAINSENFTTIKYANNTFDPIISNIGNNSYSVTASDSYQWFKNDTLLVGANQQTYNIKQTGNGNYFCLVSKYCFSYKSNTISATVGILTDKNNAFRISPNPSIGKITVYANNSNEYSYIIIYNSLGQEVNRKNFEINNEIEEIDISNLSNGLYHCTLHSINGVYSEKFLLNR